MNWTLLTALTVLPESVMETRWFSTLAAFVAINTVLYVTLSVFKIMPKLYVNDFVKRHGRRAETRSIHPDGEGPPDDYQPEPGSLAAKAIASQGALERPPKTGGRVGAQD
jgi:hypothetical protein